MSIAIFVFVCLSDLRNMFKTNLPTSPQSCLYMYISFLEGVNITRIVNRPNSDTIVTSHYGVTVIWNNVYNVQVTVRGRYINRTVGLCGTYNGIKNDDFWTSYGATVNDRVEFANSWKVDPSCENATEVDNPCDVNSDRRWIAQANCSTLLRAPFNECANFINATEEGYIDDCEYDMCACEDDPVVCYCQALDAYAGDCASHVDIEWEDRQEFSVCGKYKDFISFTTVSYLAFCYCCRYF